MATVASNGLSDPDAVAGSDPVQRCYRTLDTLRLELPEDLPIDGGVIEFRARTVTAFPPHLRLFPLGLLPLPSPELAGAMLDDLTLLVADGTFVQVDRGIIGRIAGQVAARPVLAAFAMPTGIVHGDMTASNLFVSDDGYRLIDWQRPIRAPSALDVAALLESTGCDPGRFIAGGIAQLFYLLRLAWFVQCARRWFPAGAATYDGAIVRLVEVITTYNE